ncbi:MAG: HAMP domain-containing sensor histidine kinase [Victivallaceae bacterium]
MISGIRTKLLLGFSGLFVIVAILGILTMGHISGLGQSINVILRENYNSVIACQNMRQALEGINGGIADSLLGKPTEGQAQIDLNLRKFRDALTVELNNITVPGEKEKAEKLQTLFEKYAKEIPVSSDRNLESRRDTYFKSGFDEMNGLLREIIQLNQDNMLQASNAAKRRAEAAFNQMLSVILACAAAALMLSIFVRRWILAPIHTLIESADDIRHGNLDVVLEVKSRDEIGLLSEAFNAMAEELRRVRSSERRELMRNRQANIEVFKALPDAVAVLDLDGRVEMATETAERYFGLKPGVIVKNIGLEWLSELVDRALLDWHPAENTGKGKFVQHFIENREHFFQPSVVPIPAAKDQGELTGCSIIIKDVTRNYEQNELKRGVVATLSHQLKTPVTSLRMSIHLLLDEKIGVINEKQTELLIAARDDSERLSDILDNLLDISRIESGKDFLEFQRIQPAVLVRDGVEPFLIEAKDKCIRLEFAVSGDLPEVNADPARIDHVFSNLMSNSLRFTNPGGSIEISAEVASGAVKFTVKDTGKGIPQQYQDRIFEQFFRIPGQEKNSGAGLGLAIVKEIIEAHDGSVGVESDAGQGATFWFTLPLAEKTNPVQQ